MTIANSRSLRGAIGLVAVLAIAGCTGGPGGFGSAGSGTASDGFGGAGSGSFGDPTSPQYFQQAIGDRVLFPVDQSTLSPEGQELVAQQAAWLMENGAYTAVIEGHADERGTREYNLALGARRASAVRDFMVAQGVADNRLDTLTFGKERPIEICSDENCYSQNRRAVTVLSAGPGS